MMNKIILSCLVLLASNSAWGQYYIAGVNAETLFSLQSDDPEGGTSGTKAGVTLGYGFDQYFGAAKLNFSNEAFSGSSAATQKQLDIEFDAGMRLTPKYSLFVAYRNKVVNFERTGATPLTFEERFNHYGAGVAFNQIVAPRWVFKADVSAYYLASQYEGTGFSNTATGYSAGASVGVIRLLKNKMNVGLTSKLQKTQRTYFTGGQYSDLLGSMSVSVAKIF